MIFTRMDDNQMEQLELEEFYSQTKDRFIGIPTGDDVVLTPTEEVIQRIQSDPSVQGFLIVDSKGIIKRSSVDLARAIDYKVATKKLVSAARYAVKNLDPRDDLKFLRIRTKNTEIMLGPENGDTLVVIQSLPNSHNKESKDEGFKKE